MMSIVVMTKAHPFKAKRISLPSLALGLSKRPSKQKSSSQLLSGAIAVQGTVLCASSQHAPRDTQHNRHALKASLKRRLRVTQKMRCLVGAAARNHDGRAQPPASLVSTVQDVHLVTDSIDLQKLPKEHSWAPEKPRWWSQESSARALSGCSQEESKSVSSEGKSNRG